MALHENVRACLSAGAGTLGKTTLKASRDSAIRPLSPQMALHQVECPYTYSFSTFFNLPNKAYAPVITNGCLPKSI
jgi:hypothetical protein